LKKLPDLCGLSRAILDQAATDEIFQANWDLVTRWSEQSRYETSDKAKAKAMLDAIIEENSGVMPWITQRW
jgi:hypothetical protein